MKIVRNAQEFADALGIEPGDVVRFVSPPFARPASWQKPTAAPTTLEQCPAEWYGAIPLGFVLTKHSGEAMIYRQGDVILRRVHKACPVHMDPVPHRVTLAVGENSGHSHVLDVLRDWTEDDRRYVDVAQGVQARVEGLPGRHDPITLDAGTYEVIIEREYRPDAIRRVED